MSAEDPLSAWLQRIGFTAFESKLREAGLTEMSELALITDEDLTSMGVPMIKRKSFLLQVNKLTSPTEPSAHVDPVPHVEAVTQSQSQDILRALELVTNRLAEMDKKVDEKFEALSAQVDKVQEEQQKLSAEQSRTANLVDHVVSSLEDIGNVIDALAGKIKADPSKDNKITTTPTPSEVKDLMEHKGVENFTEPPGEIAVGSNPFSFPIPKGAGPAPPPGTPLVVVGPIPVVAVVGKGCILVQPKDPENPYDPTLYKSWEFDITDPNLDWKYKLPLVVMPNEDILVPEKVVVYHGLLNTPINENITLHFKDPNNDEQWQVKGKGEILLPEHGDFKRAVVCAIEVPGFKSQQSAWMQYPGKKRGGGTLKLFISPPLPPNELRFILHWKEEPRDLDFHCKDSLGNHIYYSTRDGPNMKLDVDVTTGHGPETITIKPQEGVTYFLFVHHFSGNSSLRQSGAYIMVHGIPGLQQISAPTVGESAVRSGIWKVLAVKRSGENFDVRKVNVIANNYTNVVQAQSPF